MLFRLRHAIFGIVFVLLLSRISLAQAANINITITQSPVHITLPAHDLTMHASIPTDDAQIFGTIQVNQAALLYISLSTTQVILSNGISTFTATVRGTIGNTPVSVVPVPIMVSPTRPAAINLILDIDEGSLSPGTRAGVYTSSPFQIIATQ